MKRYKAFSYAQILMIMFFSALMAAMTIPVVKPLSRTQAGNEAFYNTQIGSYLDDSINTTNKTNYTDSFILHAGPWWGDAKENILDNQNQCSSDECKQLALVLGDGEDSDNDGMSDNIDGFIDDVNASMEFLPDANGNDSPNNTQDTNLMPLRDKQIVILIDQTD